MTIDVATRVAALTPDLKDRLRARLETERALRNAAAWQPYPWQVPPTGLGAHDMWLMLGGRGSGKTEGAAHYVWAHVQSPPCTRRHLGGHRIAVIAPTLGDAIESCVNGPSGLRAIDPRITAHQAAGGTYVEFPNGSQAKVFGANTENDVERLRAGGNRCLVWLEEMAAMRYLAAVLDHSAFGLRIGEAPHFVASTTPKPRPEVRRLVKSPHTVVTRGTTDAAHHLPAAVRARFVEAYAGTRLGRQELGGELLEDVEGALWTQVLIDAHRVRATDLPDLGRTIVAVDPNAGGDDAAGIVVVALGATRVRDPQGHPVDHAYVLADLTLEPPTGSPQWARAAVDAYHRYAADAVVAEINNGGDMVGTTIRQYDRDVRYRAVTATRGKAVRAEPVVGLYEQGRVHHVGSLPKLEDQLTTWTPAAGWSPDRLDALVWGCTDLMLKRRGGFASAA